MTIAALSLNVLLTVLLVAALVVGWRLERRLRTLREGHDLFARSVAELNVAAARAEAGLSELRNAIGQANLSLAGQLQQAEQAVQQLDQRMASTRDMPVPARSAERDVPLTLDEPLDRARLNLAPRPLRRSGPLVAPERSRTRVDDDLFEEPVRPAGGMR